MQVFNKINNKNKALSLAFGFFDGVHIGHQAVIKSAVDFGNKYSKKSAVITFQDHPCCFFYNIKPKYIISKHDKIKMIENLGVDYLYFLKFDEYLSIMSASDYLKEVIIKNFAPTAISTGFNHYFGAKKSGDVQLLKKMQEKFGYKYFEIPPILYDKEIISSTRIRDDFSLGNVEMVNAMLGYDYFLEETVIEGQKLGRELGFKTANLIYPDDLVEIGRGVYQVKVEYNNKTYDGVANYGLRPTVSGKQPSSKHFILSSFQDLNSERPCDPEINSGRRNLLEVHILNFDKDIYGENIKVTFLKKIREEKKFNSLEDLKSQIKEDINSIR